MATVSIKFLVIFFLGYVLFKVFLFYRLNSALRRMEEKQKAVKTLPAFDATRQRDQAGEPPRAAEL